MSLSYSCGHDKTADSDGSAHEESHASHMVRTAPYLRM